MAAQDWNFAALDDEYQQLNGGPWAGLNGFANADDLGEHWSSDTWNEPYQEHAGAQVPAGHTSQSHAPTFPSSPPQRVNNDQLQFDVAAYGIDSRDGHLGFNQAVPDNTNHSRQSRDFSTPHPSQRQSAGHPGLLSQYTQARENTTTQSPSQGQQAQYRRATTPAQDTENQAVETDSEDSAIMSSRRRRQAAGDSPVDLTQSPAVATASASQQSRTRKRSSTSNGGEAGSAKKRTKRTSMSTSRVDLDEPEDEVPSADAELLQAQQREALKMQETNKDEGAVKIGQRTCIICLENYTNATTAVCGHIFCHECLTRALMASEKNNDRGKGNCPACRKAINRKNAKEVIPISFLKKSAFQTKGRQAHNR